MQSILTHKIAYILYAFICLLIVINITKKLTKAYIVKNDIEPHRRKLILNLSYLLYYIIFFISIPFVLGVSVNELIVFVSSILAVLGVGFFAQWSMLSNLTASIILFFYHPVRIGDTIRILDKELDLTGEVKNITGFYVLIKTSEGNREITIPNTVILYKGIELIKTKNNR